MINRISLANNRIIHLGYVAEIQRLSVFLVFVFFLLLVRSVL